MSELDVPTVRPAIHQDLLSLVQLLSEANPDEPTPTATTQRQVETWETMLASTHLTTWVAAIQDDEHDAKIVGTALFQVTPNLGYDCRPTGFIEAVRVSEQHRRQGIAQQILSAVLDSARDLGCHKMQLLAHKRHAFDGAHALYRSMGFHDEAEGFRLYLD